MNCCGFLALVMSGSVQARQAPLSVDFSRQEYWSGLPIPSPGGLPNPEMEPGSPASQAGRVFTIWATEQLRCSTICCLQAGEPGKSVAHFSLSPKSWEPARCSSKSQGLKVCEQERPCLGASVTFPFKTREELALCSPFCPTWGLAGLVRVVLRAIY